jgi:hypothetical protein
VLLFSDILGGPAVSSEWWAATFTHPTSLSMSTPPKPAPEPASLLTKYVVDQQPPSAHQPVDTDVNARPWQPTYMATPADRGGGGDSLRALEDIRDSLAQLRVQLGRDTRIASQPAGSGRSSGSGDSYRASLYSPPSAQYSPIAGLSPSSSSPRAALQSQPELHQRAADARMRASYSGERLGGFMTPPRSSPSNAPADALRSGSRSALYEAAYPSSPPSYERYSALAGSSYSSRTHATSAKLGVGADVTGSYASRR